MSPYQLTFQLSKIPICPGCNSPLVPQCWTIRLTLAMCSKCAKTIPTSTIHHMMLVQSQHGAADWSVSNEVFFLTPRNPFPRNMLWHIWAIGHYEPEPTQPYPPHTPYREG